MFDAESWMLILWIKKEQNHEWNVINCRIIGIKFIVSQESITCGPPCWFCVLKSKDCVFLSVHSDFENNNPKLNINVRRTVGVLQFIFGVRFQKFEESPFIYISMTSHPGNNIVCSFDPSSRIGYYLVQKVNKSQ